jgi:AraC-like DNA-binding protein
MQIDRYFPPLHHPLHRYLHSIWRAECCFSHTIETILPKQNVDILFNLGAPEEVMRGDCAKSLAISDFHVAGPQTGAFTAMPQGKLKLLGVSLKMDGCSALLSLPLTEITDQTVEGEHLFPEQQFLWEQVAEMESFEAQRILLVQWLMRAIQPAPYVQLVQQACWALREQPTGYTLDQLSAKLHLSSRHLRRMMLRHVGIGPGEYMRLSRFVKSLYMMPQTPSLMDIAYNVHYSDQAHFCRDFKEIAGMTPSEYRQRASNVPGHIFAK